jgi:hypothetical protein
MIIGFAFSNPQQCWGLTKIGFVFSNSILSDTDTYGINLHRLTQIFKSILDSLLISWFPDSCNLIIWLSDFRLSCLSFCISYFVYFYQFVGYYTKLNSKNQGLSEKMSITRRSLSTSTRSVPFGPACTVVPFDKLSVGSEPVRLRSG